MCIDTKEKGILANLFSVIESLTFSSFSVVCPMPNEDTEVSLVAFDQHGPLTFLVIKYYVVYGILNLFLQWNKKH